MTLDSTTTNPSQSKATPSATDPKDLADLQEVIGISPSFRALSKQHIEALVRTARIEHLPADQMIEREGEKSERLFLILKGDVDAFWGEALREVISNLTRGDVSGTGLILDEPSIYTFATQRKTVVASWDNDALRRAELTAPGLRFQLGVRLAKHARLGELGELLQHAPLFRNSSSVLRHRLLKEMTLLQFPSGSFVYKEGEPASYCYLVVRGEVELKQKAPAGQEEKVSILGRGVMFGDADLLTSEVRTESAEVKYDTEVLAIDRIDIEALRRACGSFRRALIARIGSPKVAAKPQDLILIVNRLSYSARSIASLIPAAFLATGEKNVAIVEVVPEGYTGTTDGKALEIPRDPDLAIEILDEHAKRLGNRYLVLYTGIKDGLEWLAEPVWDKIIDNRISSAVYFTDDLQRPFPIETPQLAPVQYVEVQSSSSAKDAHLVRSGSIRLVIDEARGAELRYEALPSANQTALQRLARTLSHQAIGVALGGGSAWCYAHVALLRGLHDAGIPVDMLSGTSMGSVIACAYGSTGLDGLDTLITLRKETAFRLAFAPLTRKPLEHLIKTRLLKHRNLQDMPLPTFPVAVDIQTGRARIFRHGPIMQAMFASAALPTLFPPEIHDGVRYVDGGIANNVPVSALVEEGADFIIASNVIPTPSRLAREIHKRDATRILSQLSPFRRAQDGLRSLFLLMHEAGTRQATAAQVTFAPVMGKFGPLDYHVADKIVEQVQPEVPRFIELVKERYSAFCRNRDY